VTKPAPPARVITSDDEAIEAAHAVAAELAPGASARDRGRVLPTAEMDLLSASGLLGVTVPRSYGGAEVSVETLTEVFQILSAADSAIGQLPQNHFVFVDAIAQDGSAEQKAFFYGELLKGRRFGNAQAERGGVSALDLKTRLTPAAGGGYRLDGVKYYCTGAILAHWIPVSAIDEAGRSVLAYVGRNDEGVEVLPDWNAMGQKVTFSGTSTFTGVRVPADKVVPHWKLFQRPNLFHPFGSLLHAAIDVGIARNALADAKAAILARSRPRLGAAASSALEDPHVLLRFGQFVARLHAAEAMTARAARLFDVAPPIVGEDYAAEVATAVSEAKAFVEDVAVEITSDIFAVLGSSATDEALNLDRHWRNARTHTVHDANQWRYHAVGARFLTGVVPGKPLRKLAANSGEAS
jgi:SfnB family sulfur acquisition oxidoreductase